MKVLHFYKSSLPQSKGGVEYFIDTLSSCVKELGVESTVLSLAEKPESKPIYFPNYQLIQVKQNFCVHSVGFSLSAFSRFKSLSSEADIIHYHFPYPLSDIFHFLSCTKKPAIVTYHSDIIKQKKLLKLYKPLMNKFLKSVDRIVTTSPNYLETSIPLQRFRNKVDIIPLGINLDFYTLLSNEKINFWKERLPPQFFLFVGVMRYYKGLPSALEAVKGTNIQLVLAGSGGIKEELISYARQNGLSNVHFVGSVSDKDKAALLSLCYGFLFPSHLRSEAFGISLLEASASGKPMITCEIGTGTSYVNIHKKTGLVVPPLSSSALREAMEYLLNNPTEASIFGMNAQKRAKKLFSSKKQAEAYFRIYRKLLSSR